MKRTARFLGAVVGLAAIISSSQVAAAPALAKSSNVCVSASPPPGVTIHSIYQNGNSWSIKYTYQDRYGAHSTRTESISPSLNAFHVGGGYSIRLRWYPCSVVHTPKPVLTRGEMEAIGIIARATFGKQKATSGSQLGGFNDNMQGNAATAAPNVATAAPNAATAAPNQEGAEAKALARAEDLATRFSIPSILPREVATTGSQFSEPSKPETFYDKIDIVKEEAGQSVKWGAALTVLDSMPRRSDYWILKVAKGVTGSFGLRDTVGQTDDSGGLRATGKVAYIDKANDLIIVDRVVGTYITDSDVLVATSEAQARSGN